MSGISNLPYFDQIISAKGELNVLAYNYATLEEAIEADRAVSGIAGSTILHEPDGSHTVIVVTSAPPSRVERTFTSPGLLGRDPFSVRLGPGVEQRIPPPRRTGQARRGIVSPLSALAASSGTVSKRLHLMTAHEVQGSMRAAAAALLIQDILSAGSDDNLTVFPTESFQNEWDSYVFDGKRPPMEREINAAMAEVFARVEYLKMSSPTSFVGLARALGCEKNDARCVKVRLWKTLVARDALMVYATAMASDPGEMHLRLINHVVPVESGGDGTAMGLGSLIERVGKKYISTMSAMGRTGSVSLLRSLLSRHSVDERYAAGEFDFDSGYFVEPSQPETIVVGPEESPRYIRGSGGPGLRDPEIQSLLAAGYVLAASVDDPFWTGDTFAMTLTAHASSMSSYRTAYEWASDYRYAVAEAGPAMDPRAMYIAADALAKYGDPESASFGKQARALADLFLDARRLPPAEFARDYRSQWDWQNLAIGAMSLAFQADINAERAATLMADFPDLIAMGYWKWFGLTVPLGDRLTTLGFRKEFLDRVMGLAGLGVSVPADAVWHGSSAAAADLQSMSSIAHGLALNTPFLAAATPPPENVYRAAAAYLADRGVGQEELERVRKAASQSPLPTVGASIQLSSGLAQAQWDVVYAAFREADRVAARPLAYDETEQRRAWQIRSLTAKYIPPSRFGAVLPVYLRGMITGEHYVLPGEIAHEYAQVSPFFRSLYEKHPLPVTLAVEAGPEMLFTAGLGAVEQAMSRAAQAGRLGATQASIARAARAASVVQSVRHLPPMAVPDPFNVLGMASREALRGVGHGGGFRGQIGRAVSHAADIGSPILAHHAAMPDIVGESQWHPRIPIQLEGKSEQPGTENTPGRPGPDTGPDVGEQNNPQPR